MPLPAAREFILTLAPTCTAPLDQTTIALAWDIEDRTNYSWWDCMMLGAALRAGCQFFVSEDLVDGQIVGEMRIINPFQTEIESLFVTG